MVRNFITVALIAGTSYAAPAARRDVSDDSRIERQLADREAGVPQSCINPSPSQGAAHYGNTVLIKDRAGVLYRTHFEGGCTADDNDITISRRPTTQLCRGDIIEIREPVSNIFRGACSYSDFTPYRRVKTGAPR